MRTGKSLIWTKVCYRPDGGFTAEQMNPTDSEEEETASEQNLAILVGGTFSNGFDDFPISHFVMCLYPHPFFSNINVKRFIFIQFDVISGGLGPKPASLHLLVSVFFFRSC